jgi:hypothetical protein
VLWGAYRQHERIPDGQAPPRRPRLIFFRACLRRGGDRSVQARASGHQGSSNKPAARFRKKLTGIVGDIPVDVKSARVHQLRCRHRDRQLSVGGLAPERTQSRSGFAF